jgi:DNA invertase Pin-like site-specific DNA recombinase
MSRIFGYARPTESEPEAEPLAEALAKAGAKLIFLEKSRPQARRGLRERKRLLDQIGPGDTLILTGLDRLGTSFEDVLDCLELLIDRGVNLKVLDADFKTGGKADRAYSDLLKLLAGARSTLRSEAIRSNLADARAKGGRAAGKEPTLKPEQWPQISARIGETTLEIVAQELGVHRQTLWHYRRRMKEQEAVLA